ncbi:MAG: hypothetical protein ACR2MX_12220, partial [Cyclobacteriaceae bacterium]
NIQLENVWPYLGILKSSFFLDLFFDIIGLHTSILTIKFIGEGFNPPNRSDIASPHQVALYERVLVSKII